MPELIGRRNVPDEPDAECVDLHRNDGMIANVSVLIPTYNRASLIVNTLASVMNQSTPVHEIIVVDDGSTDQTAELIASLSEDPEWVHRLRYVHQENQGKSVALNRALDVATGDWIAFNDSDDLWAVDKIESQLALLEQHPECDVCVSNVRYINSSRHSGTSFAAARYAYVDPSGVIDDAARLILDAPHGIFMQTVLVRADTMRSAGPFDPRFRVSQDTDFLFRLALESRFCYVSKPLVELDRTHNRVVGLMTEYTRRGHVRLQVLETMYQGWQELVAADRSDLAPLVTRRLRGIRFEQSDMYLRAGDPTTARSRAAAALRTRPSVRGLIRLLAVMLAPHWCARRACQPPR